MDAALFTYLNMAPSHVPAFGPLAVTVAQDAIFLYAVLLLWLWVRPGRAMDEGRRILLLAVLAAMLSLGVNAALNVVVPRPRPFLVLPAHVLVSSPPQDASFPSDHAAVTTAIGVALIFGCRSAWGVAAIFGAVIIGTARVMVGIHYPSDIAGGMLVGAACAAAVVGAGRRLLQPVTDFLMTLARRLRLG